VRKWLDLLTVLSELGYPKVVGKQSNRFQLQFQLEQKPEEELVKEAEARKRCCSFVEKPCQELPA